MTKPTANAVAVSERFFVLLFDHTIGRKGQQDLQILLDEKIRAAQKAVAIDVWLDSPGGDAHAAYKIALDLRHRCSELNVVVPDYAKSAATLLCLGMDTIYMGPCAELGPLDVQMEHPHREGQTVSGLDIANSMEFLGHAAVSLVIGGGAFVRARTDLPRAEVLRDMTEFVAKFFQPAMAKLDPHLIHRAANMLDVATHYGDRLLQMRNQRPGRPLGDANPQEITRKLVNEYPAHGCVISRTEARDLGLAVRDAEDYPHWPIVQRMFHEFRGRPVTAVLSERELVQEAKEQADGTPPEHPQERQNRGPPKRGDEERTTGAAAP